MRRNIISTPFGLALGSSFFDLVFFKEKIEIIHVLNLL
ncbi:hypothetical protein Clopa_0491 [Clostridium pasteurianum BC1]|uniref:Uncharacterized protein n=1 Tax=Clostridium pasteurianum BC1 TaxID=86416 RepID=R4K4V2_CLOPA|nr:hypothetical protein Clopa_0491 [Clostridium pasteurianum BC1]